MSDDHPTPQWLQKNFQGWFDPCPLHPTFNGLIVPWGDKTFANIPYSHPMLWVQKAIAEAKLGKIIVLLVRVDPSTKWWLELVASGAKFAFFHGRIRFDGEGMPNFASALVFLP